MTGQLLALLTTAAAVAGGAAITYLEGRRAPISERLAIGACLGSALFPLVALPVASVAGLSGWTVAIGAFLSALPLLVFTRPRARAALRAEWLDARLRLRGALAGRDRTMLVAGLLVAALAILLIAAWRQALLITPDGIQTRSLANRSDLAFHIGMIARTLAGGSYPPEHPEFANAPLTYPFLVNFGAALLVRAGAPLDRALLLQNTVLVLGIVVLAYHWARELTGSRFAAICSPLLVLLGSGVGWLVMLRDFSTAHTGPIDFLMALPHSYTLNTANLQWGNIATIMMLPGRSLLLGLPLILIVVMLWWRAIGQPGEGTPSSDRTAADARSMVLAGVVTGLLPLAHTHSFGVALAAGGALALLFPYWRLWVRFFAAAAIVALPQLVWIARGSPVHAAAFFGWAPGWVHAPEPLAWFWFKNTGLFIPLLVVALLAPAPLIPPRLRRFYLPFLAFFIVPNLVRLAPRLWDNNKVLIYWYIASVPLVALLLARLWGRGTWLPRLAAVGLVLSLSVSGVLDAWRVASGVSLETVFDREGVAFADRLQSRIPSDALIVRATTVNHPVLLAGRRSFLGYPRRVWSHGFDSSEREAEVACVYSGCGDARHILDRHAIDYIVVGPPERESLQLNEQFLGQFPVELDTGGYRLLHVVRE